MYAFLCSLWPYLVGGLIGWLLCGLLARRLSGANTQENIEVKTVDNPEHLARIAELESRVVELESSTMSFAAALPELDLGAAKAAGLAIKSDHDFTVIEGVGPKISELINNAGITSFFVLSQTSVHAIQKILDDAGSNFSLAVPTTWPEQAGMAANNQWEELKKWQDELDGGV